MYTCTLEEEIKDAIITLHNNHIIVLSETINVMEAKPAVLKKENLELLPDSTGCPPTSLSVTTRSQTRPVENPVENPDEAAARTKKVQFANKERNGDVTAKVARRSE